ncbi:MAG: transposase [Chroococcales cyanobacterium]
MFCCLNFFQKMRLKQKVRCPNCGSHAERQYIINHQITQTQCPSCDYLMVNCSRTGKVVEAYAPGIVQRGS